MEAETATMWLRKAVFWSLLGIIQFIDVGEAAYRSGYRSYRSYRSGYSSYRSYRTYNSYYRSYYYGYYDAGSGSGGNMTAAIVGGVIGGLFLIALVFFVIFLRCKYVSSFRRTSPVVVVTEQPVIIRKREAKSKPEKVIFPRKKKTGPPLPLTPPGHSAGPEPGQHRPPSAPPAYDSVYPPSKSEVGTGVYPPPQLDEVPNAFVYKPPF